LPEHEELHEPAEKKRHGRLESRTDIHFAIPKDFPIEEKWGGIKSIGVVVRETISAGKHSVERSCYISSLPVNVTQFAKSVRSHWGIENSCHWSLDVNWREDALRTMERRMAANPAWIRRFTLSLLKQCPDKNSLRWQEANVGVERTVPNTSPCAYKTLVCADPGYEAIGEQKHQWAQKICPCLSPETNQSPSFQYFYRAIRELAGV
jgi:predicted transposase YbfD/YdcC